MCGIVGLVDLRGEREFSRARVLRMNDTLSHRGPDGDGVHVEPGVAFGHRRLAIIDLEGGKQPLYNEDETVVVTFNGEIYNFREIAPELVALGHKFRTHSDTEVIVHAWEQWGADCVHRFNGMFAFAIWDRNRKTLFLARDRLGVKPLYYSIRPNGVLLFGSELKALMIDEDVSARVEPTAIEDYLAFGYIPDPRTIYVGVHKLEPGHVLLARRGDPEPKPKQYWDVPFKPVSIPADETQLHEELMQRFKKAVERRLISEVPLGAFLSGGVDSSAVVAMMAELSTDPVKTCSISFGNPAYNEAVYAKEISDRYQTKHSVEQVDPDDFSLIDKLAPFYDEPYADSSAIPTYRVCQLARRTVTVALSGDGGDESFAGYRRYRWHAFEERWRRWLPDAVRGPLFGLAGALYPKMDWAPRVLRAKATLQGIARDSVDGYLHSVSILTEPARQGLYSPSFKRDLQGYRALEVFRRYEASAPTDDSLSLVQYLDYKTYLPGDILTKVDRASMAHSLEVRGPLLDYELVSWVSGLPPSLKLHNREGKYVFKRALRSRLPDNILYRPKMGFAVPLANWFRGPLRERVRSSLLEGPLLDSGLFNRPAIERLVTQHETSVRDHSSPLWALLMLDAFQRNVLKA